MILAWILIFIYLFIFILNFKNTHRYKEYYLDNYGNMY